MRARSLRLPLALLVAIAAVAVSARALGDPDEPPLTGYAARAERICAAAHARLERLPALLEPRDVLRAAPVVIVVTRRAADALEALPAPAAPRREAARAYVVGLRRQAAATARLLAAARQGDDAALHRAALALQANAVGARRAGARLGAPACGGTSRGAGVSPDGTRDA